MSTRGGKGTPSASPTAPARLLAISRTQLAMVTIRPIPPAEVIIPPVAVSPVSAARPIAFRLGRALAAERRSAPAGAAACPAQRTNIRQVADVSRPLWRDV